MAQDSNNPNKTSWILWPIGVFTAICVVAAIWFFFSAAVYRRDANEIGDFLAGVFAPLAFLWLIAAVFLQREELSAQRQELKASRAVAQQHVKEARRNVTFIEEQTKLLEDQRKQARQEYVDSQIDDLIAQIGSLFSELAGKAIATWGEGPSRHRLTPIRETANGPFTHYISDSIRAFDNSVKKDLERRGAPQKRNFTRQLRFIVDAMDEIEKQIEAASPSKKIQISSLDFKRMRSALRTFMGE